MNLSQSAIRNLVQHSVTVNSGRVRVTPLSGCQGHPLSNEKSTKLDKIVLRAVCKDDSKVCRSFTLRNIDTALVCSCDDLKIVIRSQLCQDITQEDFDVGYVRGSTVIRSRSEEDVYEVLSDLNKPNCSLTLWCDGLKECIPVTTARGNKRKKTASINEDSVKKKKKSDTSKEDEVQETVENLKEKYGSKFTLMQYRIWGEMITGGLHEGLDDPPNTTMFARSGGGTPYRKKSQNSVSHIMSEAATAITSALSPKDTSAVGSSPAKVIEGRSKLYRQLSELQNLKSTGILSESEFCSEKESIMSLLHHLNKTVS